MPKVSGLIYTADGFTRGTVHFQSGLVTKVTSTPDRDAMARGLILPSFFNAHTHLGDSVVLEEPQGTLDEIVGPPDGLKFRRLRESAPEEIVGAMRRTILRMVNAGTAGFCDFREGGPEGSRQLEAAMEGTRLRGMILGRPVGLEYDADEVDAILEAADGLAVSSISDWPYDELKKLSRHARGAGKLFSLHASEGRREDLDLVLDLKPDFLVHMTSATEDDWVRCAEEGVPVVICPRSQMFFGRVPDIAAMRSAGLELYLGTDNAMLTDPSMMREMEFAYRAARLKGKVPPETLLPMAHGGAKLLSGTPPITIKEGSPSNLLVLDVKAAGNAAYQVIKANEADIALLSLGPAVWVRQTGWLVEA